MDMERMKVIESTAMNLETMLRRESVLAHQMGDKEIITLLGGAITHLQWIELHIQKMMEMRK